MKKQFGVALALTLFSDALMAEEKPTQTITKFDQHLVQQAPLSNFSGTAQFSRLPVMPSAGDIAPTTVTFAPNTITNWHIHPNGQYLIVIDGEGRTQEWGKLIQNIQKGDVVWCPPNVKHWHGASVDTSMTHIAISAVAKDDQKVTWLEKVEFPQDPKEKAQQIFQKSSLNSVSLTPKQLSLIPIAAFTATGDIDHLTQALISGLERGLSVNEIKEALAHIYAYAGFPRSLNGLLAFKSLLEQRKQRGIEDIVGITSSPSGSDINYYQLGTETLGYLTKAPAEQPLIENFSPTIDYALKAHLFGYLFSRDNLNYIDRELVTISTLSALEGVNNQLTSHFKVAYNLGLSDKHFQQIIKTLEKEVSASIAKNSSSVWQKLQSTQATSVKTK